MKTKKKLFSSILLMVGIIVLINFLSDSYFFRLDFTADKSYTLSDATKDILHNLKKTITVKAYFSENIHPDITKARSDFKDLLTEYANRSKGKVVYTFINPNEKEESEKEALQAGIEQKISTVQDKDQVQQKKVFMGAVIQAGDQSEVIKFMQPGISQEYALSSKIKKLTATDKHAIGFLQGHGEAPLSSMQQAMNVLTMYDMQEVKLDGGSVPDNISTLLIIDPKDTIPDSQLQKLDEFMSKGKNIFIAYNRAKTDPTKSAAITVRHTGLEDWLKKRNIVIDDFIVLDAVCGTVNVNQPGFPVPLQMSFPYHPLINKFDDQPIVKGLEQVLLRFPSPIKYTGDSSVKFTPILKSSPKSATVPIPGQFAVKNWTEAEFPLQNIPLGAAISGKINGSTISKMVVIANGDFAVNGEGPATVQLPQDNINLLVNALDWLSDDTGLIELRTKGVTSRPLDKVEDSSRVFLKYLNFFLPILLVAAYGFYRVQVTRRQRMSRMEEDFS